jgi:hypothetical protein
MQAEGPNRRFRSFSNYRAAPVDLVMRSADVSAPSQARVMRIYEASSRVDQKSLARQIPRGVT